MIPIESIPVGTVSLFSFKDPYQDYVINMLKLRQEFFKLEVTSIISMKDHIKLSHRDPYSDVYKIVGLDEVKYKRDLDSDVPLITFTFIDEYNSERIFRIPLSYISEVSDQSSIEYVERSLIISTDMLPFDFTLEHIRNEVKDFVEGRVGVGVIVEEIVNTNVTTIAAKDHEARETIRKNAIKYKKSLEVRAIEAENELQAIHEKLRELKIQLGS